MALIDLYKFQIIIVLLLSVSLFLMVKHKNKKNNNFYRLFSNLIGIVAISIFSLKQMFALRDFSEYIVTSIELLDRNKVMTIFDSVHKQTQEEIYYLILIIVILFIINVVNNKNKKNFSR